MRSLISLGLLAMLSMASAVANEAPATATKTSTSAQDLELIYQLAVRPVGIVQGDRCEIRGAVWGYGPRPDVKVALVNVQTGEKFEATTNKAGIFSLSTPYPGMPVIYAEHLGEQVFVKKEMAKNFKISQGGVVCDHRLTTASSKPSTKKETK